MNGRIRAEQIDVALHLAPLGALCNLSVVLVVAAAFWRSESHLYLGLLTLSVVALSAITLMTCLRWHRKGKPPESRMRDIRLLVLVAAAYGVCLASIPVELFVCSDADFRLLIACTTAGLIAVSLSVSAVPAAAIACSVSIIVGAFYALASTGQAFYILIAVLLLLYALFIILTTLQLGAILLARIVSELKVERQKDVIGFLLNEFQEGASDWIWEIDRDGLIRNPSARFCRLCRMTSGDLAGMALSALLEPPASGPSSGGERGTLWKVIESGATFRNALVCVRFADEQRWWSLSGKPVLDFEGRLAGYRGVGSDVTIEQEAEARLSRLACFDGLTDLPNRHSLYDRLGEARQRENASGVPYFVLCLDLDEFKSVNDAFGHAMGDGLLRVVATRLRRCMPPEDVVARLSGDEFAILAHGAGDDDGAQVAARILAAIAEPLEIEGIKICVHISIGIAFSPCASAAQILRRADLALYRAKREGGNGFRFFEAEMDTEVEARRALASDLRSAQSRDEFVLNFQPIVAADSLTTSGFEALLRWRHPTQGFVSPSTFIPIAEENGSIVGIGEWVIREACRAAAAWPAPIGVAVNLSPVQLRYSDVVKIIEGALADSGLAACRLEVEITETTLLDGNPKSIVALERLLQMGVRLALDDFGTGYSSMSYLLRMRFDKIKIDRSFVRNLPSDPGCLAIVRSVIGLGRSFGMKITAEGVETPEQLVCLRAEGCEFLQGYIFSGARSEDQLAGLLQFRERRVEPSRSKRPVLQLISG